jgi:hypothetical protein
MSPELDELDQPTRIAWRTRPRKKTRLVLESPGALTFGTTLAGISIPVLASGAAIGLLPAVAGLTAAALGFGPKEVDDIPPPMPGGPEGYKLAVQALLTSPNELERRHDFLGWVDGTNRGVPVLVHDDLSTAHFHILGPTGSNKSTRVAIPFCQQRLMKGDSVLYLNLKGTRPDRGNIELNVFTETMRALRRRCYFFSLKHDRASNLIGFFGDPWFVALSVDEQTDILIKSFSADYGDDWGKGYFAGAIRTLIRGLLIELKRRGLSLTAANLYALLFEKSICERLGMNRKDFNNASVVHNVLASVARNPALNLTGNEPIGRSYFRSAFVIDRLFCEPCAAVFELPALINSDAAKLLARFYSLLAMNVAVNHSNRNVEKVFICIDECQEMLQRSIALTPFAQARDFGVSLILVHQNLSDLRRDGPDFTEAIVNNTSLKVHMAMKDSIGRKRLIDSSGKVLRVLEATTESKTTSPAGGSEGESIQKRQTPDNRIDENEINRVNTTRELAVFEASPASGYTRFERPTIIEIPFSMTKLEFKKLESMPWPKPDGKTCLLASDLPAVHLPEPKIEPKKRRRGTDAEQTDVVEDTKPKRKRKPKPVDPEEETRAAAGREKLRAERERLRAQTKKDIDGVFSSRTPGEEK